MFEDLLAFSQRGHFHLPPRFDKTPSAWPCGDLSQNSQTLSPVHAIKISEELISSFGKKSIWLSKWFSEVSHRIPIRQYVDGVYCLIVRWWSRSPWIQFDESNYDDQTNDDRNGNISQQNFSVGKFLVEFKLKPGEKSPGCDLRVLWARCGSALLESDLLSDGDVSINSPNVGSDGGMRSMPINFEWSPIQFDELGFHVNALQKSWQKEVT